LVELFMATTPPEAAHWSVQRKTSLVTTLGGEGLLCMVREAR
jgi:hypothetical protein